MQKYKNILLCHAPSKYLAYIYVVFESKALLPMETFDELIASDTLVLIDFFAEWCGPCKAMKPVLEDLKKQKGDSLRIIKIDADKHQQLAAAYHVQSIPTLMLFRKREMLWRHSGYLSLNELTEITNQFI